MIMKRIFILLLVFSGFCLFSVTAFAGNGDIDKYNDALIKMCEELGVEYLDSSEVLLAHSECYGYDGIHLSRKFYSDYWLRFVVENKGIVG